MAYQNYLRQLQEADNNASNLQNLVNEQFEEKKTKIGEKARLGEDILAGVLGFESIKNLKRTYDDYQKAKQKQARNQEENENNENEQADDVADEVQEDLPQNLPQDVEMQPMGEGPDVMPEGFQGPTAQQQLLDQDPEDINPQLHPDPEEDPEVEQPEPNVPEEDLDVGEDVGQDVAEDVAEDFAEDATIGSFLGPVGEVAAVGFGLYETFKSLFDEGGVKKQKIAVQAGLSMNPDDVLPTTQEI